jgi:hypothetical protein
MNKEKILQHKKWDHSVDFHHPFSFRKGGNLYLHNSEISNIVSSDGSHL